MHTQVQTAVSHSKDIYISLQTTVQYLQNTGIFVVQFMQTPNKMQVDRSASDKS